MKTRKLLRMAAALLLLAGLTAGAMAQSKTPSRTLRLPPEPIVPVVTVNAIEVTDGTPGFDQTKQEIIFGYSFLGQTTGAFPGSFTLSMNCTAPPQKTVDAGITGAVPLLPPTVGITGGTWTLPVYATALRGTGHAGSLYGSIAKGTMNWDKAGTAATLYVVLNVDGGTQSWDGVGGFATFTGTLFVDEKTQKTMLNGTLVFNIISPTAP